MSEEKKLYTKIHASVETPVYELILDFAASDFEGNLSAAVNKAAGTYLRMRKGGRVIEIEKGFYIQKTALAQAPEELARIQALVKKQEVSELRGVLQAGETHE